MAIATSQLGVRTHQGKTRLLFVLKTVVLPAGGGVAGLTLAAIVTLVNIILTVTAAAAFTL